MEHLTENKINKKMDNLIEAVFQSREIVYKGRRVAQVFLKTERGELIDIRLLNETYPTTVNIEDLKY